MNAATILKSKGRGVVTATANKSLLDIAKLLVQHGADDLYGKGVKFIAHDH